MRSSWLNSMVLLIIAVIPLWAYADQVLKPTCVNIRMMGWRIAQRLESGVYEIVTREGGQSCWQNPDLPNIHNNPVQCMNISEMRSVLITNGDKFDSTGVIRDNLWVENSDKNPETRELPLANGFKKKYRVARESVSCTKIGEQKIKEAEEIEKIEEAKRKIDEKKVRQREIAAEKQEHIENALRKKKKKEVESLWKE